MLRVTPVLIILIILGYVTGRHFKKVMDLRAEAPSLQWDGGKGAGNQGGVFDNTFWVYPTRHDFFGGEREDSFGSTLGAPDGIHKWGFVDPISE